MAKQTFLEDISKGSSLMNLNFMANRIICPESPVGSPGTFFNSVPFAEMFNHLSLLSTHHSKLCLLALLCPRLIITCCCSSMGSEERVGGEGVGVPREKRQDRGTINKLA